MTISRRSAFGSLLALLATPLAVRAQQRLPTILVTKQGHLYEASFDSEQTVETFWNVVRDLHWPKDSPYQPQSHWYRSCYERYKKMSKGGMSFIDGNFYERTEGLGLNQAAKHVGIGLVKI